MNATARLSMETRGIVIHGEVFVAHGEQMAAAWADLAAKLEALGIQVRPYGFIRDAEDGRPIGGDPYP